MGTREGNFFEIALESRGNGSAPAHPGRSLAAPAAFRSSLHIFLFPIDYSKAPGARRAHDRSPGTDGAALQRAAGAVRASGSDQRPREISEDGQGAARD